MFIAASSGYKNSLEYTENIEYIVDCLSQKFTNASGRQLGAAIVFISCFRLSCSKTNINVIIY